MNRAKRIKAYAIFAGGGVKALALAGALVAAQERFEFVGYGGASAGALIALLAASGRAGSEFINLMRTSNTFTQLLEDGGKDLETVLQGLKDIRQHTSGAGQALEAILFYLGHMRLVHQIVHNNGLYSGETAHHVIRRLLVENNPELDSQDPITFASLRNLSRFDEHSNNYCGTGFPILKLVATDVRRQRGIVYPNPLVDEAQALSAPVIPALIASMCYPFLFWPRSDDNMILVDGGVSSNLPIYLFRDEHQETGYPIIAFDLIDRRDWDIRGLFEPGKPPKYPFFDFGLRLLNTALGSTDRSNQRDMDGVRYVRVPVDSDLTLKAITPGEQKALFGLGFEITKERISDIYSSEMRAHNRVVISRHNGRYLLQAFVAGIMNETPLRGCRAYVMLPTSYGTRKVACQFNMDGQPDERLEVGLESGATGAAWKAPGISVLDLDLIRNRPLSAEEQAFHGTLPPNSQHTVVTVPLYDLRFDPSRSGEDVSTLEELPRIGTLTFDTTATSGEVAANFEAVRRLTKRWARIMSMYLR